MALAVALICMSDHALHERNIACIGTFEASPPAVPSLWLDSGPRVRFAMVFSCLFECVSDTCMWGLFGTQIRSDRTQCSALGL